MESRVYRRIFNKVVTPPLLDSTLEKIQQQECSSRSDGLQVICAGLPRTGTLSLKAALTHLLGGRCYHGFDNLFGGQDDVDFWLTVANGSASDEQIREFFCSRGCTAVADFPAAYFYTRLLKVFPEAIVILTQRSSESWQKSMQSSLLKAYENRTQQPYRLMLFTFDWRFHRGLDKLYDILDCSWMTAVTGNLYKAEEFCHNWAAGVRNAVAQDHLLVLQAGDGWEELCSFLQKPIPETPYPRLNNVDQFQQGYHRFRLLSWMLLACCLLFGLLLPLVLFS